MLFVSGWATVVAWIVLHVHTSFWHFFLFNGKTKVFQRNTEGQLGWVGERRPRGVLLI